MSLDDINSAIDNAVEYKAHEDAIGNNHKAALPYGFRITKNGVEYFKKIKEEEIETWSWMSSYLVVTALTRDEKGNNWGRILEFIDSDSIKKEYVMPMELLSGNGEELRRELLSRGVLIAAAPEARKKIEAYLAGSQPGVRATCVDKVGWFKNQYVLPHKVYGQQESERIVFQSLINSEKIGISGTLPEWQQHVGRYIIDNPILYLSACVAFVGPLLHLLNEENFAIHLTGNSSIGKTTAAHIARSMWGNKIHSWRTTDNAAESIAKSANDGLLIFDELGEVDAKAADNMAYMLGNGSGKGRANRKGDARPITTFRTVILSTGEVGLEGKLNDLGKTQKAGQAVRFIEIEADAGMGYGIYRELHSFEKGENLSDQLKKTSQKYSGILIDEWLKYLTQSEEVRENVIKIIKALRDEWKNKFVPSDANGQVNRCGRKFALLAAVGEFLTHIGLLPKHPNELNLEVPTLGILSNSIDEIFQSWVIKRGGNDSHEITEVTNHISSFINQHGSSRFESPWSKKDNAPDQYAQQNITTDQKTHNRAGYRKFENEVWNYYFFKEVFRSEILKGKNEKYFLKELVKKNVISQDLKGNGTISMSIPGEKQQRLICINPSFNKGDDHE